MRDHDLRESLLAVGQLQPALEYEGQLLDGRRRSAIFTELGRRLDVRVCITLQEACSLLWANSHAERAVLLAQRDGATSVLELARLCGATPSAIAVVLQAHRPKKSRKAQTREAVEARRGSSRMVRRVITFEPELLELAKVAAKNTNANLAQVVRDAVWKVVRFLPGAPRHQPRRVQAQSGARRRAG